MLSSRSFASLAQFLGLQAPDACAVLLQKHGVEYPTCSTNLIVLRDTLMQSDQHQMLSLLEEIARTEGNLRAPVTPKHRFDERWQDLVQCLLLDGYALGNKQLQTLDPSIGDAVPIDDDLLAELQSCGAPRASDIIRKINDSSDAFRAQPPNYNACLNDARVALETLAGEIAKSRSKPQVPTPDFAKWGSIIHFLCATELITLEEERGLVGVYGFLSPGSHRPIGVSDGQMARLGRSFALNMCWFLLKRQLG